MKNLFQTNRSVFFNWKQISQNCACHELGPPLITNFYMALYQPSPAKIYSIFADFISRSASFAVAPLPPTWLQKRCVVTQAKNRIAYFWQLVRGHSQIAWQFYSSSSFHVKATAFVNDAQPSRKPPKMGHHLGRDFQILCHAKLFQLNLSNHWSKTSTA